MLEAIVVLGARERVDLANLVAKAAVSSSTFFDYFPRKEDVLHKAGATLDGGLGR